MKKTVPRFGKSEQLLMLTIERPSFQKKVLQIRELCHIPLKGFPSPKEAAKWDMDLLTDISNIKQLNHEVRQLLIEHKLPENVKDQIDHYIRFGTYGFTESLNIIGIYDKRLKRDRLYLEIFNHTSLEDVKAAWSRVTKAKKFLADYQSQPYRELGNLKLEKRASELKQSGHKLKEIARIFEDEDLGIYSESYISKLITRYKRRIKA